MNGIIVVNGYYTSASQEYQVSRLIREFSVRDIAISVFKNREGYSYDKGYFADTDFVIFLDKDIFFAQLLADSGLRLFNSVEAIRICDSKSLTMLKIGSIAEFPPSVIAPLRYHYGVDETFLDGVESKLGYPILVKKDAGSLGLGQAFITNRDELFGAEKQLSTERHMYQKYIGSGELSTSQRAFVIGGKYVYGIEFRNERDFRSNASRGGEAYPYTFTPEQTQLAERIADKIGLDYCAVDFIDGGRYVIEVNSNAYYTETERVSKINIAAKFAESVIKKVFEEKKQWMQ